MGRGFYQYGMGFAGPLGWIGAIIGVLIVIAVIVALVLFIVWAIRAASGRQNHHMVQSLPPQNVGGSTAKEIAQARYAKGEITREEYQQILADLNQ